LPAKFQLKKGTTGKFRFVVLSSNGQVVATSEAYERKASALAGIRAIEKIVASSAAVEDTTTKEWAEAEAAKKAAKKNGVKKAAKKAVTKASSATSAAAKTVTPKTAASTKPAGKRAPARQTPPPLTKAPSDVVPRI
jgi:uncharacterized protein YegP (UPF0339 family)